MAPSSCEAREVLGGPATFGQGLQAVLSPEWRRISMSSVATRYDKLTASYHTWLVLAALLIWLA